MLYPVKIEFKDYPSGSWQDWSEYLSEPPQISKKVESENEGEAGLIVFDDAEVSFIYEVGNPVYNAFSIDLTSKQRYLFRISAPKSDTSYVQLFEGMADFSTLKWNEFNNILSFSIVDKLSALNLLQDSLIRTKDTLNTRVLAQYPSAAYLRFAFTPIGSPVPKECSEIWMRAIDSIGNVLEFNSPIIFPGELIRDPHTMNVDSSPAYYLVTESWIETNLDGQKWNKIKIVPSLTAYHDGLTIEMSSGYCEYLEKEVYGIDVLNYQSGIPQSIDGLKFLEVFIKSSWSDITVTSRGISTFNIALSYAGMLVDEKPFGKDPLDVLKMLADSMKVYVFTDKTGNIIVQSKSPLDTGGTTRSIGSTNIVSGPEKKYFWDKLTDGAVVNALSWVKDEVTGKFLTGVAEITKQETGFALTGKIKPKNPIRKDIIVGNPTVNTQAELDTYTADIALSILDFYGKRHSSFDLTLNLDDNTIDWELIDNLSINSLTTFFTKLDIDLVSRTISLEAVEIRGHDYDFRQLVFGSAESSGSSIISSSSSGGGSFYGGITPIFNLPLQMSSGIVSLLTTDNLKLTSDQLDTAQPIKTTDTPTFNQMLLSAAATLSNHAVRADRTLQITTNAPLTGGGIAVDLTADRNWTLGINSASLLGTTNQINVANGTGVILGSANVTLSLPQDIHSGATPTFNQMILSSAGTGVSNAVRADRTINTSAPLTGGGNLTADRTFGLSYNATNLKLTSNALNTIQDIATNSIPTFNNIKLNNLTANYIAWYAGSTNGFANSVIYTASNKIGISTTTVDELLNINGSIKQFGNSAIYNNFTSGWTGAGWRLDYGITTASQSSLEVDNLRVRGTMSVYELIINQIRATNGSLFVSSTAKVASVGVSTVADYSLTFEDPEGHGYMPFADNDIIMMQRVDLNGTSIVKYLIGKVLSPSSNTIEFLIQDGTDVPQKGDVFVRIGSTSDANRQGTVYLTSDDTASPYIDIYDGVNNYSLFKTSTVRKVRLGKLTGLTDSDFGTLSGYGLYATNAYLKGGIWATFGNIGGWTIDTSQIYNSSVRLESSATLKGLGVKDGVSDVLKVGDFTNASETYATATMPNAPNPASAWTNEINVNNRLTWNSYGSNYGMASSNTDFTSYQWRTYLTLPINDIKGKTITISFGIAERGSINGSSKATNIWAYIKTDVGTFALMDVTPAGGVYLLGNTPTYETRTLTATIPSNATYARFYIAWYKNGAFDPADVLFNNWSFLIYNKTIVELNKTGLKIYNSPISRVNLTNSEAAFDVPLVKASTGIQLGENWSLVVEPYLEGDGVTLNERLTLKYKGTAKGYFSQTDGTYSHV